MGKLSILTQLRLWIGSIGWRMFIWGSDTTEEKYWDDVSSAEKTYTAIPSKYEKLQGVGYCCFEISNRRIKIHQFPAAKQMDFLIVQRKYHPRLFGDLF